MQLHMKKSGENDYVITKKNKMIIPRIRERIEHLEKRYQSDWYDPTQLINDVVNLENFINNLLESKEVKDEEITYEYNRVHELLDAIQ